MRVAAIDIGTNTVLLLVAEHAADGSLVTVAERATITRLGQGVDETRRLAPEAVVRTAACLDEYARLVRELGVERVGVVATSAMRDASGGDVVRDRVRARYGVEPRVLSGLEEARLTFRGAVTGLSGSDAERLSVFDIGGGSTEVVVGRIHGQSEQIEYASSFDLGSVRLTERHVTSDPPTIAEQQALVAAARSC